MNITKTRLFKYIENFTTKNWKFSDKNSYIFHISAQNIDCRYSLEPPCRGGSNEYPQSMLLSRNKKNNVYPCKPQFYYIKVGLKGVKIILVCFRDGCTCPNQTVYLIRAHVICVCENIYVVMIFSRQLLLLLIWFNTCIVLNFKPSPN